MRERLVVYWGMIMSRYVFFVLFIISSLSAGYICEKYPDFCEEYGQQEPIGTPPPYSTNNAPKHKELPKSSNEFKGSNALTEKYQNIMKEKDVTQENNQSQKILIEEKKQDSFLLSTFSLKNIYDMKKGTFESTDEFIRRQKNTIASLEEEILITPKKDLDEYSAGIATMTNYNADIEEVSLSLKWKKSFKSLVPEIKKHKTLTLKIPRDDARTLFDKQEKQPLTYKKNVSEYEVVFLYNRKEYTIDSSQWETHTEYINLFSKTLRKDAK